MKKYIIYIILGFFVLPFTSCDLDLTSPSNIVDENFWKTENDAWYALNACYSQLPSFAEGIVDEMTTDNAHSHKPWEGPMERIQGGSVTAADGWGGYGYSQIRRTTNFIVSVDKCEIDAKLKQRMKAEAQFLRAFEYLNLTIKFGRVPLITEVLEYDAPYVKRSDLKEIQNFILDELDEASQILPDTYKGGKMYETGRVTRAAALSLRARAALYFGNYSEAEKSANAVITENHHDLFRVTTLTDAQQKEADEMVQFIDFETVGIDKQTFALGMFSYEGLWQGQNSSPTNPEYILTHEYMEESGYLDYARYQYVRPSQLVRGYSSYEPIQDLVDAYWDIDGKTLRSKISEDTRATNFEVINAEVNGLDQKAYIEKVPKMNLKSFEYMNEFRNRDARLYASMLIPFFGWHVTDFAGGTYYYRWDPKKAGDDGNESWSGYSFRKMVATHGYDTGGENHSYGDFPLIRFAEVLLIAAESRIHNTGYDGDVQKHLNRLRMRCGMPNVPTSMPSKDAALEFMRNERRIELAGEGHRYADIRRYGEVYAKKVMSGTTYAPNKYELVKKDWENKLMLMPIPQSAIDLNPLLKDDQNPGY